MSDFEPHTPAARWSRRLGIFSVAVAVVGIFVQRGGRLDTQTSLAALGSSLALAGAAILLAMVAFAIIWFRGSKGAGAAFAGALAGAVVIAAPAIYCAVYWKLPALSDIATDPASPPAFILTASERAASDNAIQPPSPATVDVQAAGYPDIAPLEVTTSVDEVYPVALELAQKQGWRILDARGADSGALRIEAVAATPVLRLLQDVVVQIKPEGTGSRVDVRSASRWGKRDFGTNARRVRAFLADLAAALG
jgi:uncharacterized protein (DUF1499 family)